ncbi:hypothetical protein JCM9957A_61290 [Kineosporia succinea]
MGAGRVREGDGDMTDILAAIDAVLDQQPDLFEHVLVEAFGDVVWLDPEGNGEGAEVDLESPCGDSCQERTLLKTFAGTEFTLVRTLCTDIQKWNPFADHYGYEDTLAAYHAGLNGYRAMRPVGRNQVCAYDMGRELADQIRWQP